MTQSSHISAAIFPHQCDDSATDVRRTTHISGTIYHSAIFPYFSKIFSCFSRPLAYISMSFVCLSKGHPPTFMCRSPTFMCRSPTFVYRSPTFMCHSPTFVYRSPSFACQLCFSAFARSRNSVVPFSLKSIKFPAFSLGYTLTSKINRYLCRR